ncbi:MAG: hypothetical protein HQL48_09085, partial [Gammaproteobacteria bacterium]|nr:hypothetical protein [Gammaproteobacteria bacterium]
MLTLFRRKPLLEEAQSQWLQQQFLWAVAQFDATLFSTETQLVLPDNHFFPGRAGSHYEMGSLILKQVMTYSGIGHWPLTLARSEEELHALQTPFDFPKPLRHFKSELPMAIPPSGPLPLPWNPEQINQPQALIASLSTVIARLLLESCDATVTVDSERLPFTLEVIAISLGFGVMFANSAFTHRGGCGSCYNPNAIRQAALSELEASYLLALFCQRKGITAAAVTPHLKSHLRGPF